MTNLQRWLFYGAIFLFPYSLLLYQSKWLIEVQLLPVFLLILFGVYSAAVVLYRTLTINDCPEAAKELQEDIQKARTDLLAKGFKFRD